MGRGLTEATTVLGAEQVEGDLAATLDDAVAAIGTARAAAVALVDRVARVQDVIAEELTAGVLVIGVGVADCVVAGTAAAGAAAASAAAAGAAVVHAAVGARLLLVLLGGHVLEAQTAIDHAVVVGGAVAARSEVGMRAFNALAQDRLLDEGEVGRENRIALAAALPRVDEVLPQVLRALEVDRVLVVVGEAKELAVVALGQLLLRDAL
jgi:hypothetical protein